MFMTTLIMKHGLLNRARKIVAECLLYIQSQTHSDPLPFVKEAIRLASPAVRVISLKKGAKITRLPIPLSERQRTRAGFMWIMESCKKRLETGLHRRIAWEMIDIIHGRGTVVKLKEEKHTEATTNRANALMGDRGRQ